MTDLTLRDARISGASGLVDIEVADGRAWSGRFAPRHVTSLAGRPAAERKDVLAHLARLDMATGQAAPGVGIADHYRVRPGAMADLVVIGTRVIGDALLDRPDRRYV